METCGFCFIPRESRSAQKRRALWFRKHPTSASSKWMWQLDVKCRARTYARTDRQPRRWHDERPPYRRAVHAGYTRSNKRSSNRNVSSLMHLGVVVFFFFFFLIFPSLFLAQPWEVSSSSSWIGAGVQPLPFMEPKPRGRSVSVTEGWRAGSRNVCGKLLTTQSLTYFCCLVQKRAQLRLKPGISAKYSETWRKQDCCVETSTFERFH